MFTKKLAMRAGADERRTNYEWPYESHVQKIKIILTLKKPHN